MVEDWHVGTAKRKKVVEIVFNCSSFKLSEHLYFVSSMYVHCFKRNKITYQKHAIQICESSNEKVPIAL